MRLKKGGKNYEILCTQQSYTTHNSYLADIPSLKNRQDQTVRRRGRNKLHALSMVYMLCSMGKYICRVSKMIYLGMIARYLVDYDIMVVVCNSKSVPTISSTCNSYPPRIQHKNTINTIGGDGEARDVGLK